MSARVKNIIVNKLLMQDNVEQLRDVLGLLERDSSLFKTLSIIQLLEKDNYWV